MLQYFVSGCLFILSLPLYAQQFTINNLQCEYRINPLGIDATHPRLSWNIQSLKRNIRQYAYRVLVADNLPALQQNNGNVWDSKKQVSARSIMLPYGSEELLPAKKYFWKVQVWNENDPLPSWSAINNFTTGLFQQNDWSKAQWNELFNKTFTLIDWAIKSNLQSVVTDCPHREKLSWLEEDHLMGGSIHYNYDIYGLYRKLVSDMMDAQTEDGLILDIAPEFVPFVGGFRDSPEWGSSAIMLLWMLYTWYGDSDVIAKAYPMMKHYLYYLEKKSSNNILSHGLGDWFDYGPGTPGEAQLTPKALTATAIYYYDITLLQKMADILGNEQESSQLGTLSAAVKTAFNQKFYNRQSNIYSTGSQIAMSMPLCVGLVEEPDRPAVMRQMVDSINFSGKKLTAGDVGFHYLVKALDNGGAS
jgi:hypothetical protein